MYRAHSHRTVNGRGETSAAKMPSRSSLTTTLPINYNKRKWQRGNSRFHNLYQTVVIWPCKVSFTLLGPTISISSPSSSSTRIRSPILTSSSSSQTSCRITLARRSQSVMVQAQVSIWPTPSMRVFLNKWWTLHSSTVRPTFQASPSRCRITYLSRIRARQTTVLLQRTWVPLLPDLKIYTTARCKEETRMSTLSLRLD